MNNHFSAILHSAAFHRGILAAALLGAIVLAIPRLYGDFKNTVTYGGVDLRNRIVGARLLDDKAGSPYFYKWREGDSERYLDPCDPPQLLVNRVTTPPSMLLLHAPLGRLHYSTIRLVWLAVQYFCLLYIIVAIALMSSDSNRRMLVFIVGLVFFIHAPAWQLHVERGQQYIVFAFLICVAFQLYRSSFRHGELFSGMAMSLLVWIRPTAALLYLPFLLNRNRKVIVGGAAGALLMGSVTLFAGHLGLWQDYLKAIGEYSRLETYEMTTTGHAVKYPAVIEGMDNLARELDISHENASIQHQVYRRWARLKLRPPHLMALFLAALVALLAVLNRRLFRSDPGGLFLIAFASYLMYEFFIAAPRFTYNSVQWVFPALLFVSLYDHARMKIAGLLLLAGLVMGANYPHWLKYRLTLGELALFVAIVLAAWAMHDIRDTRLSPGPDGAG